MNRNSPILEAEAPPVDWAAREREWQRRLPRLRLGAEPVEQQLRRLRAANVVLSLVSSGIGLMFLALFSAFGEPRIGLLLGGVLVAAVVAPAWRSYRRIRLESEQYLRERRAATAVPSSPGSAGSGA